MVSSYFLICLFSSWISGVSAHAYIWYPPSRNLIGSPHVPHCFNSKQYTSGITTKWPSPGSGQYVAGDQDFSTGYCGTFGGIAPDKVETPENVLKPFTAGTEIPFVIVYNAQHGGQMEFRVCTRNIDGMDHIEGSECFDEHMIHRQCVEDCGCESDRCKGDAKYEEINKQKGSAPIFKDRDLTGLGPVSIQHGAQEVKVPWPADLGCSGGDTGDVCTVQWFWTTAWGEQFWNCIDVRIEGASGGVPRPRPNPAPGPRPNPVPGPALPRPTPAGSAVGTKEGNWSSNGATITFTEQNRKAGRVCFDVSVSKPTTVYYQSKGDIYHSWNAEPCCLAAAPEYGGKTGGPAQIWAFEAQYGFGFCECLGWTPETGGTTCAGQASEGAMKCPVAPNTDNMCSDKSPLASRPSSLGGAVGAGGSEPEPEPEQPEPEPEAEKPKPEPEQEPEPEPEQKDCEDWCDLPPVEWTRKCTWWNCATCDQCVAAPEPEPEPEPEAKTYEAKTSCPAGTVVNTEADCKKGADALDFKFKKYKKTGRPTGCSIHTKNKQVRFNEATGVAHENWERLMCANVALLQQKAQKARMTGRTKFSQHVTLEVAPSGDILDA